MSETKFSLRLPSDLHEWLQTFAKNEQRSVNSQIVAALQELRQQSGTGGIVDEPAGKKPSWAALRRATHEERLRRLHAWADQAAHDSLQWYNLLEADDLIHSRLEAVNPRLAALRLLAANRLEELAAAPPPPPPVKKARDLDILVVLGERDEEKRAQLMREYQAQRQSGG